MKKLIKFTKASAKDGYKVTVRLSLLGESINTNVAPGDILILTIEGKETVFRVNRRGGKTASTNSFPPGLEQPEVGDPVYFKVNDVFQQYYDKHANFHEIGY